MMSTHDQALKSLWQTLPADPVTFTADQMHARAHKFQTKLKRRDITEYISYALLYALIAYMLTVQSDWQDWVSSILAVGGSIIAIWNYNKFAKAKPMPTSHSGDKLLEFMHRELTRQRDAAASMWKWFLLPLMPCMMFVMAYRWTEEGTTLFELTDGRYSILILLALCLTFFGACILWQLLKAAHYQRQLDRLGRV